MRGITADYTFGGIYKPDKNDVEITVKIWEWKYKDKDGNEKTNFSTHKYRGTFYSIDKTENRVYIQVTLYLPNGGHSIYGIPIEDIIDYKGFVL